MSKTTLDMVLKKLRETPVFIVGYTDRDFLPTDLVDLNKVIRRT